MVGTARSYGKLVHFCSTTWLASWESTVFTLQYTYMLLLKSISGRI